LTIVLYDMTRSGLMSLHCKQTWVGQSGSLSSTTQHISGLIRKIEVYTPNAPVIITLEDTDFTRHDAVITSLEARW